MLGSEFTICSREHHPEIMGLEFIGRHQRSARLGGLGETRLVRSIKHGGLAAVLLPLRLEFLC